MTFADDIRALADRYAELETAKEGVETLLYTMQDIDLPYGIEGSHHAEMEWGETLEQIENEMQEIEDALR